MAGTTRALPRGSSDGIDEHLRASDAEGTTRALPRGSSDLWMSGRLPANQDGTTRALPLGCSDMPETEQNNKNKTTKETIMKTIALMAAILALAAPAAWAGCSSLTCTGNADVMITEIRQSSDNANLLLVMPYGYRTGISGCSLNTGGTLTLPHGAQGFKSIYPGLLQAILTGQYIRITLKAGAGCHISAVDFVSTPINDTTGTGGTVCGLGYCSQ